MDEAKKFTSYLHGDKESNWNQGEELGLSDEAIEKFRFHLYEVECLCEVESDGESRVVKFIYDGKEYLPSEAR